MPVHTSVLLLADMDGFFGVVFFLIAFVGWVINLVSQSQEKGKGGRKPPPSQRRPGSQRNVRSEIDQFLNQSKRSSNRSDHDDLDVIEVIAPPSQRRPPRRRRSRAEVLADQAGRRPPKIDEKLPRAESSSRPGQELSEHHLETASATRKKRTPPRSQVAQQVEINLPHSVNQHVASHLESFAASSPLSSGRQGMVATTTDRKSKATVIGSLLQSKSGIRNAIILNEILSPPKSLRK